MAKIASKDIGLYVNQGTNAVPDWKIIACSTSDGFSGSTDNVEIATKCANGWKENLPGDSTWSFSNSGYAEKTADLGEGVESYVSAEDLFHTKAQKEFKIATVDETIYYRMGTGYVSDYNETADNGDYLQFDLTITGSGDYITTPAV